MSFDLNILCVEQAKPISLPQDIRILAEPQNVNPNDYPKYYYKYCACMSAMSGIWYYLKSDAEQFSSYELCDIRRDLNNTNSIKELYPLRFVEEDDIGILCLKKPYELDILRTIKHFVGMSPIKTIAFHSRYQTNEEEPELIFGVFSLEVFVELLLKNKILFNTCYIIKGQ